MPEWWIPDLVLAAPQGPVLDAALSWRRVEENPSGTDLDMTATPMSAGGHADKESVEALEKRFREIGKDHWPVIECAKNADAEKINAYAEGVMKDFKRLAYDWNPLKGPINTCFSFANDAVRAGLK